MPPRGKTESKDKGGAAVEQAGGAAGDKSVGSVDSGDNGVEKAGTEAGTTDAAEAGATISGEGTDAGGPAAEVVEAPAGDGAEDHVTAFERRCARLVAIAEEAEFESGTIVGDIRDALIDEFKARPKPWSQLSQIEQRDIGIALEKVAKTIVRKVVIVIAEEDEISVHAKLAGWKVNGDAFQGTFKAQGDEDTALQLFRLDGHEIVIISADSTRFTGQRKPVQTEPDQRGLEFADPPPKANAAPAEITSAPPGDSSDLAEAGAAVAAERAGDGEEAGEEDEAAGDRERTNLKTGMIERHIGGGADDEDSNWADVRAATPEELAAERERLADFPE